MCDMWPSSDQSNMFDPETSIYYFRTDIGSTRALFMFCPFNLCVKQSFGDLPLQAIFFVYELSLPNPFLLWNFMEKGRIVLLDHPMILIF